MIRTVALALGLALVAPAMAQDASVIPADIGARVATTYVEPALHRFEAATRTLEERLSTLCATPAAGTLEASRAAFAETVSGWGGVSILRFGPLVADNRFESIFFWPDTRGVTLKQTQAALANADPSVTDALQLADKSVALQNLLTLDFLLAGDGAEALAAAGAEHRCRFASAVASVLDDHAEALSTAWSADTNFGISFRQPGADGDFQSPAEVMAELAKASLTTVEFVRSAELGPARGDTIEEARGRRAPFWRSNLTFELVAAQLSGLDALLAATGLGDVLEGTYASPFNNLRSDLGLAAATLGDIALPAEAAFADATARKRLDYVDLLLGYAHDTITGDLTASLGLTMGFNALDGD